jgi:DNA-binding winged helix-turn-helix (wHTH) protein/TolB-like protein/Tfp pilus assembly protein PilF
MSEQIQDFYEFDPFRVDSLKRLLLRDGLPVPLKPKVFDTLLVLIENSGRVVEKDELMQSIWPDTAVEENNLTQNISAIRKALGERRDEHRYVVTVPGRGYRFVADVRKAHHAEEQPQAIEEPGQAQEAMQEAMQEAAAAQRALASEKSAEMEKGHQVLPLAVTSHGGGRRVRRLTVAGFLILVFLTGILLILPRLLRGGANQAGAAAAGAGTNKTIESIAVLPFKPLGAEAGDEYMGPGMADALITRLSNSKHLRVSSTSAVLRYNSPVQDTLLAGRELNVDSVLDGKIQRDGGRVRVTVQLVRTSDGASLWAQTFDEDFTNIFAMQDSISEQVVRALTLQLSREERERMLKRYTQSVEAYQAYLKGRFFLDKRSVESIKKAMDYFRQAIDKDQNYALAYAGLADCYHRLWQFGEMPAQEAMPKATAAAMRALELDESLAEAHATLGVIKFRFEWDFPGAEREFKRSVELDPAYAMAHLWYALYLAAMNNAREADAEMELAARLDPLSITISNGLADYYFHKRQYDRSIEQHRKTLEMDPGYLSAHNGMGRAYEQKGMYQEAIEEYRKALKSSDAKFTPAVSGYSYALSGRREEALKILGKLIDGRKQTSGNPYLVAVIYAGLGSKDEAFKWLDKAFAEHSLLPGPLRFDPRLDSLRGDARFKNLLQRVGLPL